MPLLLLESLLPRPPLPLPASALPVSFPVVPASSIADVPPSSIGLASLACGPPSIGPIPVRSTPQAGTAHDTMTHDKT